MASDGACAGAAAAAISTSVVPVKAHRNKGIKIAISIHSPIHTGLECDPVQRQIAIPPADFNRLAAPFRFIARRTGQSWLAISSKGIGNRREQKAQSTSIVPLSSAISRSEEHTSELQSLMRHSYAVIC